MSVCEGECMCVKVRVHVCKGERVHVCEVRECV